MRLWLFIWIAIGVLNLEFVNGQDDDSLFSSLSTTGSDTNTPTVTSTSSSDITHKVSGTVDTTTASDNENLNPTTSSGVLSTDSIQSTTPHADGTTHTPPSTTPYTGSTQSTAPYTENTASTVPENASPVTAQSTIEQTTAAQQTTAEQVWAEFIVDCDSVEGYCYYNITAPFVLPGGAKNISQEKDNYLLASAATYQIDSDFFDSELYLNYSELVKSFRETKSQYDWLVGNLTETLSTAQEIQDNTRKAKDIVDNIGGCYEEKCYRSTTSSTTTTTRRPTTTPAICSNHTCKTFDNYPGSSCTAINGQAACTCPGTLDQLNDCGPVACRSSWSPWPVGTSGDSENPAPIWSVGFTGNNSDTAKFGSNLSCAYKVGDGKTKLCIKYNNMNLNPTAKLTINSKTVPKEDVQRFFDIQFNNYTDVKSFIINFQSGTVNGQGFFYNFEVSPC